MRVAGADYDLWGMGSIERALSQLVSGGTEAVCPALASLGAASAAPDAPP